jgi:DNA-binding NarL/FixJ family response regulator
VPEPSSIPFVLVVADSDRIGELAGILSEPLPSPVVSKIDVAASTGGDDTIDLVEAKQPHVVVVTATLEAGDATSLVGTMRGMLPRAEIAIVLVGDDQGPVKSVLDAGELAPDRFVSRPISPRALRFAVASALEAVLLVRGTRPAEAVEEVEAEPTTSNREEQRRRWSTLADSIVEGPPDLEDDEDIVDVTDAAVSIDDEPDVPPMPPPLIIRPRTQTGDQARPWEDPQPPAREPTLILRDPPDDAPVADSWNGTPQSRSPDAAPSVQLGLPPISRTRTGPEDDSVAMAERGANDGEDRWSDPMPLAEMLDRELDRELERAQVQSVAEQDAARARDEVDELGEDLDLGEDAGRREGRLEVMDDLPDTGPPAPSSSLGDGRDFARQLREKMSMMAQRLFQGGADAKGPSQVDLSPRHDHHTEIDLSSLGDEMPLGGGVTEIQRGEPRSEVRDLVTSPGSWDTQVRERGLPDHGEIVRGVSDAAMLLARMFAQGATGRVGFRRAANEHSESGDIVVFFDQGRPVFASSSEPRDRMGGLLVREGKITATQYERCQTVVAESGRRMGEILVDFGYLKRRELLPAVRRHVEDIVYSLFGWDRGLYHITIDEQPSGERIRLSRHPASLVLEGIRRKFDRATLDRLIGPPSTVIEVRDRERLGGIVNMGDLSPEERAALAAIDNHADLAHVARTASVDLADLLPLAWGLCVLGLATARRTDTEVHDESTALVGETDLAIDRERVRARWQLVTDADYFALLGVRRDATTFEIRRAYQSARRDFASDCFPTDLRRELAQELDDIANVLDEAFRVLRDDRLRNTYLSNLIE